MTDLLALLKDLRLSGSIDPEYWSSCDGGIAEIRKRLDAAIHELEAAPVAWAVRQNSNGRIHGAATNRKAAEYVQESLARQNPDLTGATELIPLYAALPPSADAQAEIERLQHELVDSYGRADRLARWHEEESKRAETAEREIEILHKQSHGFVRDTAFFKVARERDELRAQLEEKPDVVRGALLNEAREQLQLACGKLAELTGHSVRCLTIDRIDAALNQQSPLKNEVSDE